jgi:hypothetical protein
MAEVETMPAPASSAARRERRAVVFMVVLGE